MEKIMNFVWTASLPVEIEREGCSDIHTQVENPEHQYLHVY